MFELIVLLQLISVCTGLNPCVDYQLVYNADGLRSSDFDSRDSTVSICDAYLESETWYRFDHDAGNRLIERPVEPWFCGTQAPIWINGSHPTDTKEVIVKACATYSALNICGWNGTVRIRLCNESGSEYFVYLLAVPPGCALAYCVDAASRKQCVPPLIWLQDEFKCGVPETTTPYSTVPLNTLTTLTSTSRQSSTTTLSTSTEPTSSDWSMWGPWSVCSKPCDYGFQSRRRTCGQLPCEGPANIYRLCNEYNCQKIPEEKNRGIVFVLQDLYSVEDTMLTVVMNQQRIHDIVRSRINSMCSQNVSLCCGWQYKSISPFYQEFVTSGDIFPSQGRLDPRPDHTAYYQLIAVINEDVDREICRGRSQRRNLELYPNFVSVEVMMMACVESSIFHETGLIVKACMDPSTIVEDNDENKDYADDNVSCPSLTCIVPIVVCIIVVVVAGVVIGGMYFAKNRMKPTTESESETSEPPRYDEISSIRSSDYIQGQADVAPRYEEISSIHLGGYVETETSIVPRAIDVDQNEYDTTIDQEHVDHQKIDVDVWPKIA